MGVSRADEKRFNELLNRFDFGKCIAVCKLFGWDTPTEEEYREIALVMLTRLQGDPSLVVVQQHGLRAERVLVGKSDRIRLKLEFIIESKTEE